MSVYIHLTGDKRTISLKHVLTGKNEIGLNSITFKPMFYNIKRNALIRLTITTIDNATGDIHRVLRSTYIPIPEGWYSSIDSLISQIIKEIHWISYSNPYGYDLCVDFFTRRARVSNGFFEVTEDTRFIYHLDFAVTESIRSFLGLEQYQYSFHTQYFRARYPLNIGSKYYFNVSCNQIDTEHGDNQSVLREIPITKKFGELTSFIFDEVDFKHLTSSEHRDITFDVSENIELAMLNVVIRKQVKE